MGDEMEGVDTDECAENAFSGGLVPWWKMLETIFD